METNISITFNLDDLYDENGKVNLHYLDYVEEQIDWYIHNIEELSEILIYSPAVDDEVSAILSKWAAKQKVRIYW